MERSSGLRSIKFDVARTFAILCVVLCHCTEACYPIEGWENISIQLKSFLFICHNIGRLGVPVFLFLSGALLLAKRIETDDDVFLFYRHNLLPILILNEIWVLLYNLFFIVIGKDFWLPQNLYYCNCCYWIVFLCRICGIFLQLLVLI